MYICGICSLAERRANPSQGKSSNSIVIQPRAALHGPHIKSAAVMDVEIQILCKPWDRADAGLSMAVEQHVEAPIAAEPPIHPVQPQIPCIPQIYSTNLGIETSQLPRGGGENCKILQGNGFVNSRVERLGTWGRSHGDQTGDTGKRSTTNGSSNWGGEARFRARHQRS